MLSRLHQQRCRAVRPLAVPQPGCRCRG